MPELTLPHPKDNPELLGHEAAEVQLLQAFNSNTLPHAWLITGEQGVGKATLAYRFARFLLASESASAATPDLLGDIPQPSSLYLSPDRPTFNRVAGGAHGDLLVLDTEGEDASQEITIDAVRRIHHFLSLTAAESPWRVVIIDSTDAMNRNAANALLKMLEEPPQNTVLLLVCHNLGAILPTIRSRCRILSLRPLPPEQVSDIIHHHAPDIPEDERRFLSDIAHGAPGLALKLYAAGARDTYAEIIKILQLHPKVDIVTLLTFARNIANKKTPQQWQVAQFLLQHLLRDVVMLGTTGAVATEHVAEETAVKQRLCGAAPANHWVETWEKLATMAEQSDRFYMDRTHAAITMLNTVQQSAA